MVHPAYDWQEVARLALTSRILDELEEDVLTPQGHVTYQFSARGHELGQLLIGQLLNHLHDGASAYYRSRPFLFASGLTLEEAIASDMARPTGVSGGRDVGVVFNMPSRGRALILPMAGDVGSQYTPAAGYAQGLVYRATELGEREYEGAIGVVFGGDGSVASNGFWSSLTMATTLKLPLLFVIEDNEFAISVKSPHQTPGQNIAENLASFNNLQIWDGDGTEPTETADLLLEAVNYVRLWQGPALVRLSVPRLSGHSSVDNQAYKSEERKAEEWARDPIAKLENYLVPELMSAAEWQSLRAEVEQTVQETTQKVINTPQPDPQGVARYVYYEEGHLQEVGGIFPEGKTLPAGSTTPQVDDPRRINMVEAIRRTLDVELGVNSHLVVFGEDVGEKGGVHAATMDLQSKYGANRVFDTSLSEEGIIGRSVGLSYVGLTAVPEIQFRKYADPATEQLNNCGTIRWRTNNRFAAPIVVRMPGGYRKIGDPWHSVTSESVLAHSVGWLVAFPSNAEDTVGLLRTALRSNDPVYFFEHRAMLDAASARRPYPGDDYMLPFGKAKFIQQGDDLTVVTWGGMVERCEAALKQIDSAQVDLIDLRTIIPWDKEAVLESIGRTGKCLIVHEDIGIAGFGAEIAATLAQEAFLDLDGPIQRLTAPAVPIPFNTSLMDAVVPTIDSIRDHMRELLEF